jgi:hypothetical protein
MVLVATVIAACAANSRPSSVASDPPPASVAAKNYDQRCTASPTASPFTRVTSDAVAAANAPTPPSRRWRSQNTRQHWL